MGGPRGEIEVAIPPFRIQPKTDRDRLEQRRLARPVLADQERYLRMERQPIQPADGREVERIDGGIGDAMTTEPQLDEVRAGIALVSA